MARTEVLTNIAIALITLSLIATSLGGLSDIAKKGRLTKYHMWNDGKYLAIIAIFFLLLARL